MTKAEFFEWFNRNIRQRWHDWEISKLILDDWFTAFGGYDTKVLTNAAYQHKIYDCPAKPNTKRLLEIVKSLTPTKSYRQTETIQKEGLMSFKQHQQRIRQTYSREKRIENIVKLAAFLPDAKNIDPEAYAWAVEEGLARKKEEYRKQIHESYLKKRTSKNRVREAKQAAETNGLELTIDAKMAYIPANCE